MFEDFSEWLTHRGARRNGFVPAPRTVTGQVRRLNSACRIAGCDTEVQLGILLNDREQVARLLDRLYLKQQPQTVKGTLTALRQFGEYAIAQGWADRCAIEKDDSPKHLPQKPIEVYSEAEIDTLRTYARARGNLRFWVLLETVIETGRRISEVLDLRYDRMHLAPEQLGTVAAEALGVLTVASGSPAYFDLPTTKNKQQNLVPLSSRLREEVWTAANITKLRSTSTARMRKSTTEYPFPWHYETSLDMLARLCEVSGIAYKGWHIFRHTRATSMLGRGVPIAAVSKLLGHSSIAVTAKVYDHTHALNFAEYVG